MEKRSKFSSKIGFVLAASGSAVGLGNLWRFPYLAAQYGGGTFLLIYLLLALTFGFTMLITEIAIGRKTRLSAIGAFRSLDKRFAWLGWLESLVPAIITPYYCVIGGWVLRYLFVFMRGQASAAAEDGYFGSFISSSAAPVIWLTVFILLVALVVILGVEKGIEKVSVVLMPMLVILSIIIAIYVITRPGAVDGIIYYLKPELSKIRPKTVLAALGQLFYSLSLAMGIMVTYGSYMKSEDSLELSVHQIDFFDTLIAFIAGMMIVPAVYMFSNGDESAMSAGPGLMFITLPKIFESMAGGTVIGVIFFLLVLFAALTSAISLMETIVSIVQDRLKWQRTKSTIVVTLFCLIMAIPSSLGFGAWSSFTILGMDILDFWDFLSNSVLMPIVAISICIMIGYVVGTKAVKEEVERKGERFKGYGFYCVMVRYIAPVAIVAILITSILSAMGLWSW